MSLRLNIHTYNLRKLYLKKFLSLRNKYPEEGILLVEGFDAICTNCPPDYIQIYNGKNYLIYDIEFEEGNFRLIKRGGNKIDKYLNSDIIEIFENINQKTKWNSNPEKYGTDICNNGDHYLYHILYPSKKIESMYMRCWIEKERR